MKDFLRCRLLVALLALPLLGGCARDACERLALTDEPQIAQPLVLPEGVPAVADGGEYRVPDARAASTGGCLANPPMTLPAEALQAPEDED